MLCFQQTNNKRNLKLHCLQHDLGGSRKQMSKRLQKAAEMPFIKSWSVLLKLVLPASHLCILCFSYKFVSSRGKQQSPEVMWGCLEQDRVGGVGGRCSPGGLTEDWERCCCDQLTLQEARTYTLTILKKTHSKSAPLYKWGDTHICASKTALKTQKWHEDKNSPGSLSIYSRRIEVIFL